MRQVHLFFSGQVQGVGFRYFLKAEAKKIGVTGWTRNLFDGRVEAVAQGDEDILKKFVEVCSKGHFFSEVKNVEIVEEEITQEFDIFEKRETA